MTRKHPGNAPYDFDDIEIEVLDALLDGDWPLPHMIEALAMLGFDTKGVLNCFADHYKMGLVEFFERADLFKAEGIVVLEENLDRSELLKLLEEKLGEPKFGIDLTSLGRSTIEDFIRSQS